MGITSIILFFVYFWGFGLGAVKLSKTKEAEGFIERQTMRTGIGLAAVVTTAMLLNLANIPLDWRLFLAIALACPAYCLFRNRKNITTAIKPKITIKKSGISAIAVLLIFAASLYMYASGAFSYPYLEDDDPWSHASGIKYVATEKTFDKSPYKDFQYMNPYPPSYDFIMALMHQTEGSLYWTMKFFNALIVAISIPFFYFFAMRFTGSTAKALFATAFLAAVPAYQSHFIWAPALAMALFFPALYSLEMTKQDKKWKWIAATAISGLLLSHPTHIITLAAMITIYIAVKTLSEKGLKDYTTAALAGIAASLPWWATNGYTFFRENINPNNAVTAVVQQSTGIFQKALNAFLKVFNKWSGTGSRPYTFEDFFIAKGQNLINNPIGFGIMASMLTAAGIIFAAMKSAKLAKNGIINRENSHLIITLMWFALTFILVNNRTFNLPFGWFAFRTWMILAVPAALLAAEGLAGIIELLPKFGIQKEGLLAAKAVVIAIAITGLVFTSAQQKYEVNTAQWPPGAFWTSVDEINTYMWLKTLPEGTRVASFTTGDHVIAMDKEMCSWCMEESEFRKKWIMENPQQIAKWLKENNYPYLIIGGMEIRQFGQNETISKLNEMAGSGLFGIAYQTNGALVLEVK